MMGGRSADDGPRAWHADANQIGAMTPTSSIDAQRVRFADALISIDSSFAPKIRSRAAIGRITSPLIG